MLFLWAVRSIRWIIFFFRLVFLATIEFYFFLNPPTNKYQQSALPAQHSTPSVPGPALCSGAGLLRGRHFKDSECLGLYRSFISIFCLLWKLLNNSDAPILICNAHTWMKWGLPCDNSWHNKPVRLKNGTALFVFFRTLWGPGHNLITTDRHLSSFKPGWKIGRQCSKHVLCSVC